MKNIESINVEAMTDPRCRKLYCPSPCHLTSDAAGLTVFFDRDSPDAEAVLTEVLTKHFAAVDSYDNVEIWIQYFLDRETGGQNNAPPKQTAGQRGFSDWLGPGEGFCA